MMFGGLSGNIGFEPRRTALTIEGGQFLFMPENGGPARCFNHLAGELVRATYDETAGSFLFLFRTGAGRDVTLSVPADTGPAVGLILSLASVKGFAGCTLGIDVTPDETPRGTFTKVTVTAGGKKVPWAREPKDIPPVARREHNGRTVIDASARIAVLKGLADTISERIAGGGARAAADDEPWRVAPDIDDVPEGLE